MPVKPSTRLEKRGKIENPSIVESSGLVKSRQLPNIFWTHNDSGGSAQIFSIRGDGSKVQTATGNDSGIEVTGAENVDWEDIALDDKGYLIIGDIGNNISERKTLALYRVKEPDPFRDRKTAPAEKISIYFPEHSGDALDSEALFWAEGSIYLLTKTRRGKNTELYRVDTKPPGKKVPLIRIASFDFKSPVTGADTSPDGRLLAVLTYSAIWLFERPTVSMNYLLGRKRFFPFQIWQAEAISFDEEVLLISTEGGRLFELKIDDLLPIK
ncbi:MAG: hypothetical protein GTN81_14815 [Proteobacteria bacterium]|nr:hypothetical protein [Pseudomonadota bacterium]